LDDGNHDAVEIIGLRAWAIANKGALFTASCACSPHRGRARTSATPLSVVTGPAVHRKNFSVRLGSSVRWLILYLPTSDQEPEHEEQLCKEGDKDES
jgi:hypothetical protein